MFPFLPSICIFSSFPDFTPTPKRKIIPEKSVVAAIVASVCGIVILVGVLVTVVLFLRRRKRLKKMPGRGLAGVTFTAVSMRDRIRAESLRVLDQSKVMSLFNPDDLLQYSLDRVEYVRDLGEGNFGQVFQG